MHAMLLYAAAVLAAVCAVTHSVLGERRLIGPILQGAGQSANAGPAVLKSRLARRILRLAWHVTSLSWIAQAAVFVIVASAPPDAQGRPIVMVIGASFVLMAAISVVISRGRHVGWPMLAAVGVVALASVVMWN
jgi:hypothetical protein